MQKAKPKRDADFDSAGSYGFDAVSDSVDGVDLPGNYLPERDFPDDAVEYTGNYESDTAAEIAQVKKDFSALDLERKKASQTIEASRDTDYVVQVVFLDRKQRDAFLSQTGWDKYGKRYVNGLELARQLGVELPESNYKPPKPKTDKTLSAFALDLRDL